jgi:hypothetical protein
MGRIIIEIGAAGTLQDVSTDGSHVTDLSGRTSQDRTRQQRKPEAHIPIGGNRGVGRRRPDQHTAIFPRLNLL